MKKCDKCNQPIDPDEEWVFHGFSHYHVACDPYKSSPEQVEIVALRRFGFDVNPIERTIRFPWGTKKAFDALVSRFNYTVVNNDY